VQGWPRDLLTVADDLEASVDLGDESSVKELLLELEGSVMVHATLPSEFFERIQVLLRDEAFRRLRGSWGLVYFLNGNWSLVTEEQRKSIKPLLVATFDKHSDFMGAFVTGELLGQHYCDQDTLLALVKLSGNIGMPSLALVPHALETLARNTKDAALFGQCEVELRKLERHSNEEVRKEASLSLAKVHRPF
jgi:hypothetical protein